MGQYNVPDLAARFSFTTNVLTASAQGYSFVLDTCTVHSIIGWGERGIEVTSQNKAQVRSDLAAVRTCLDYGLKALRASGRLYVPSPVVHELKEAAKEMGTNRDRQLRTVGRYHPILGEHFQKAGRDIILPFLAGLKTRGFVVDMPDDYLRRFRDVPHYEFRREYADDIVRHTAVELARSKTKVRILTEDYDLLRKTYATLCEANIPEEDMPLAMLFFYHYEPKPVKDTLPSHGEAYVYPPSARSERRIPIVGHQPVIRRLEADPPKVVIQ